MPSCRICNKPLIWKQPYKKGDRPVEKDGSTHNCSKWQKENTDLKPLKGFTLSGFEPLYA